MTSHLSWKFFLECLLLLEGQRSIHWSATVQLPSGQPLKRVCLPRTRLQCCCARRPIWTFFSLLFEKFGNCNSFSHRNSGHRVNPHNNALSNPKRCRSQRMQTTFEPSLVGLFFQSPLPCAQCVVVQFAHLVFPPRR